MSALFGFLFSLISFQGISHESFWGYAGLFAQPWGINFAIAGLSVGLGVFILFRPGIGDRLRVSLLAGLVTFASGIVAGGLTLEAVSDLIPNFGLWPEAVVSVVWAFLLFILVLTKPSPKPPRKSQP
jgi:hypothetical protein